MYVSGGVLCFRDLVEEFCVFGIWPLAKDWKLELGVSDTGLPSLTAEGCKGMFFLVSLSFVLV